MGLVEKKPRGPQLMNAGPLHTHTAVFTFPHECFPPRLRPILRGEASAIGGGVVAHEWKGTN